MASPDSTSEPTPYLWTNARLLAVDVPISRGAGAALLPEALALTDPPTATLFVADYPETRFGSIYREAAVLLHSADSKGPALHCPWMVVDDDTALILGRELLGFPKKMAEIMLEERGDRVIGTVRRKGAEIVAIEAELGAVDRELAPLFGRRMINVIGTPVTGLKLLEIPPTEERVVSSRLVDAKVTLASSERDALGELEAPSSATGRYLTLHFGREGAGPGPHILGDVDPAWSARRFYPRAM